MIPLQKLTGPDDITINPELLDEPIKLKYYKTDHRGENLTGLEHHMYKVEEDIDKAFIVEYFRRNTVEHRVTVWNPNYMYPDKNLIGFTMLSKHVGDEVINTPRL